MRRPLVEPALVALAIVGLATGCAPAGEDDAESTDAAVVGVNESARRAASDLDTLLAASKEETDADRLVLNRISAEIATVQGKKNTYHVHFVWPKGADPYKDENVDTCAVVSNDAVFFYNHDGGVAWWSSASDQVVADEAADFAASVSASAKAPPTDMTTPQGLGFGQLAPQGFWDKAISPFTHF